MSRRRDGSSRADVWKVWLPLGLLVVAGFGLAILSIKPPPPRSLKIAAGSRDGAYYAFAHEYRAFMATEGYELEVLETNGSVDNLRLLRNRKVDLALVQGGSSEPEDQGRLESLASLFFEPVWVFWRGEGEVEHLAAFRGDRLAIGAPGSGTRQLALCLLAANDIDAENSQLIAMGGRGAADALLAGELDAAIFVSSPQAEFLPRLMADAGIRLLSFRRHLAYSKDHRFLSRVILGEGTIDLADNLPAEDVSLLAAAASLVARQDLHPDLTPLLLETMAKVHGQGGFFADPKTFPSEIHVGLPLKPEAQRYLANGPSFLYRILPFSAAAAIDRLKILLLPLITLLFPIFKIAPPIYRWRIRSRIYRWYDDLRQIDGALVEGRGDAAELAEQLAALEREVATEVSVPLSYMGEYYRLRTHIELIEAKLEDRHET